MEILVCTVSDRASRGEYEDRSGPRIAEILAEQLPKAGVSRRVVSDEPAELEKVLRLPGCAGRR